MGLRGKPSGLDTHPQKRQILKKLLDPLISNKQLATEVGVSIKTIEKWKARSKQLMMLSRQNMAESTRDSLMADVQDLHNESKELLGISKRKQDVKGGAAVLNALVSTLRLKGEVMGVLGNQAQGTNPSQQGNINIGLLIGFPRAEGVPLREGGDGSYGPSIDIVEEKAPVDFYGEPE
jgi:transposase